MRGSARLIGWARGIVGVLVAFALCGAASRANAGDAALLGISSKTLENGLDVIVIENRAQPLATIEIAVKNGAYTEPPEYNGLSHLYEHMFFKANATIPNQERYMERLRELGASWNGTTSTERVNYYMTVHKKNLREGAGFLRDALLEPLFLQEELTREWPVVLGEFDRNEAEPSFHLMREVDRRLWHKHFSRKNTIGDRDVIFNATREQMREIQRRYYVPNNSALLVGGDVNSDEVFEMAERLLGDWKRADNPHKKWPEPEHPPIEKTSRIAVVGDVRTATIQIAWHGPMLNEDAPGTLAADVLSFVLAQPDSNFQKALVDTGLVDGVGLSYYTQDHTGPINLTAQTSADRLDKAWTAIEGELAKLYDPAYITDDQIESAKNTLEIQEIYGREQTSEFVHTISFWWCTGGLDYYVSYIDNLRKVSRADMTKYVARYIEGKPRIESVLVAEGDLEKYCIAKSAEVIRPESGSSIVAHEAASGEGKATEEFDVDGLPVVLRRNPLGEVVVAQFVLAGGLQHYGPERAGLELALLETLDKGSAKFGKEEVNRRLASTGSSMSASAVYDYSSFTLRTLRRDFEGNFALFADAIAEPLLDDAEVKLAIERRLQDIRQREQTPDAYISILASRNLFKGHPYEVPPQGSEGAVKGLDRGALKAYHAKEVNRARGKLFVVGNVGKDELTKLVREGFAKLPKGEYEPKTIERELGKARLLVEERKLPTNYIFGCFDAPNPASGDYAAFQVAVSILSDRLFEEVRTKRNLSYAVAAVGSTRMANYGALYVTAVRPNETVKVMLDEAARMKADLVPEKSLRDKIEESITEDLVANQAAGSQCARLAQYDAVGGGWRREADAVQRMRAVTNEQVRAAAEKYFKSFHFAVLGQPGELDEAIFGSR